MEPAQLTCHTALCGRMSACGVHQAGTRSRVYAQVPLPRSTEALRWLQGQPCAPAQLMPHVYFSPRHSSAPDTPGGTAASAAASGLGAVAGTGRAWTWQGWQCAHAFMTVRLSIVHHLLTDAALEVIGHSWPAVSLCCTCQRRQAGTSLNTLKPPCELVACWQTSRCCCRAHQARRSAQKSCKASRPSCQSRAPGCGP